MQLPAVHVRHVTGHVFVCEQATVCVILNVRLGVTHGVLSLRFVLLQGQGALPAGGKGSNTIHFEVMWKRARGGKAKSIYVRKTSHYMVYQVTSRQAPVSLLIAVSCPWVASRSSGTTACAAWACRMAMCWC